MLVGRIHCRNDPLTGYALVGRRGWWKGLGGSRLLYSPECGLGMLYPVPDARWHVLRTWRNGSARGAITVHKESVVSFPCWGFVLRCWTKKFRWCRDEEDEARVSWPTFSLVFGWQVFRGIAGLNSCFIL